VSSPSSGPSDRLQVVAPFWLDRPELEAVEIAVEASRSGFETMWVGEMATFDAFALATAIGLRAPGLALKIGPLAIGVRSPVALALGLASVSALTGARADLALGASSPEIVAGWHDRQWAGVVARAGETVEALRSLLAGERADYRGEHVRARGFRLARPMPDAKISLAAFGPQMTRLAARAADELVLNLVTPERVSRARELVEAEAHAAGRRAPAIAVWVAVARDPGPAALAQLAGQAAVYLRPPGYGEMFAELGFGQLVERARAGARRGELAGEITRELLAEVCAIGSDLDVRRRLDAYLDAGATHVGVVPATAEDPGGRGLLSSLAPRRSEVRAA
jgi:probable F420-dependent oxidoreductase